MSTCGPCCAWPSNRQPTATCRPTGGTASAETLNAIPSLGHHFIVVFASSCTVALSGAARAQGQFQAIDALAFPDAQPRRVCLRYGPWAVFVSRQVFTNKDGSQGILYLVSSDTRLNQVQLMTIYQKQWKVEEYHKSLKENISRSNSPSKTTDIRANHFFISILAYTKLGALKLKYRIRHFRLKAQLYLTGPKAMH